MKLFKNVILLAISVTILSSCVTKKRCNKKFPPEVSKSDSINTFEKIVYRDTLVHDTIPGDSVVIPIPVDCDPVINKPLNKKESTIYSDQFIEVKFGVNNNQPWSKVVRKPIYRDYLFHKIYSEKLKEHFTKNSSVVTVTEYKMTLWGWILIAALLLILLLVLIRR